MSSQSIRFHGEIRKISILLKRVTGKQCRPRSDGDEGGVDQGLHCLQMV